MKKCSRCKQVKSTLEFRKDITYTDGYFSYCVKCAREVNKKHKNKIKEGTIKAF